jgi:hypothetical protein
MVLSTFVWSTYGVQMYTASMVELHCYGYDKWPCNINRIMSKPKYYSQMLVLDAQIVRHYKRLLLLHSFSLVIATFHVYCLSLLASVVTELGFSIWLWIQILISCKHCLSYADLLTKDYNYDHKFTLSILSSTGMVPLNFTFPYLSC